MKKIILKLNFYFFFFTNLEPLAKIFPGVSVEYAAGVAGSLLELLTGFDLKKLMAFIAKYIINILVITDCITCQVLCLGGP